MRGGSSTNLPDFLPIKNICFKEKVMGSETRDPFDIKNANSTDVKYRYRERNLSDYKFTVKSSA